MTSYHLRRRENKYELSVDVARVLQAEIARHLPVYSFVQGPLDSYMTTVYFDTENRALFRRAERSFDDNLKVRLREYYYATPCDRVNGASSAPEYRIDDACFVELKQRRSGVVTKRRFRIPKVYVGDLFAGKELGRELEVGLDARSRRHVRVAYSTFCKLLGRMRVQATSVVVYHRVAYQESERELRVTFDDQLRVYRPPAGLYAGRAALTPSTLGEEIAAPEKVILEIKCRREYPQWLAQALRAVEAGQHSKFTTSVRSILAAAPEW